MKNIEEGNDKTGGRTRLPVGSREPGELAPGNAAH
jgi:hypothetical protein